jgi:hypothetical protein
MTLIGERPEWHQRAACRGVGTQAFFPERGETTVAAIEYCNACEVRDECGAHALTYETDGVWAGQSERSRKRLRRAAGITRIDLQADDDRGGDECPHGHPFDDVNTRIGPDGRRRCRKCAAIYMAEYKTRRREA